MAKASDDENDDFFDEPQSQSNSVAIARKTRCGKNLSPDFGRKKDGTGPGRKVGSRARASGLIKKAIQGRGLWMVRRLFTLAKRRDGNVALGALKMLMAYGYGRPTVVVEISPEMNREFAIETPPKLDHEQWVKQINDPAKTIPVTGTHVR